MPEEGSKTVSDPMQEVVERQPLDSLNAAFKALYLEVDASIVDDLRRRFQDYERAVLAEEYQRGRIAGAEWMRGEAAAFVKDYFECDCGCPKAKYNTESGHAMNCPAYEAVQCAKRIESLPLLPEGKRRKPMLSKQEVLNSLRTPTTTCERHIYEAAGGGFHLDYATFPGGRIEPVSRSVIDELEREGLIERAFSFAPTVNTWKLRAGLPEGKERT